MNLALTTGASVIAGQEDSARALAAKYDLPFVARRDRSLARLAQEEGPDTIAVLTERGLVIHRAEARLPFTTGLAELRIQRVQRGEHEPLVNLAGIRAGDRVLDCTLGLCRDALVMAAAGAEVEGVEAIPLLAAFAEAGLARLTGSGAEAARRVSVRRGDYGAVLTEAPERSYDVVYFDPMFGHALAQGADYELFRALADPRPLDRQAVTRALRVARRAVVVKDGPRGSLLKSLGHPLRELTFGNRVRFGVLDAAALSAKD